MSKKDNDESLIAIVLVVLMLAVGGYYWFQHIRWSSQRKAITGNLRQIASAGQQYILEESVTMVGYTQLEGSYFATICNVRDETYTKLTLSEDGGTIWADTDMGRVVFTY